MQHIDLGLYLGPMLLLILGLLLVSLLGVSQQTLLPAATAYSVQVALGLIFFSSFGLVADDGFYHRAASDFAIALQSGETLTAQIGDTKASFVWILGGLYFLLGSNPVVGILFNALLMGLVPSIMALGCRKFRLGTTATTAAWVSALIPQFLFWSPWLRREALSFFLLTVLLLALSMLFSLQYIPGLALLSGVLLAFAFTRAQLVAVGLAGALVTILLAQRWNAKAAVRSGVSIAALLLISSSILGILPTLYFTRSFDYDPLNRYLKAISRSDQTLGVQGVSSEFNASGAGFILNAARTIAGPFPWEWQNAAWAVAGFDGLFFLLLIAVTLWGAGRFAIYRRQIVILAVTILPLLIAQTVLLGNYGIVMRVRAHMVLVLIPIIAIALNHVFGRREKRASLLVGPKVSATAGLQGTAAESKLPLRSRSPKHFLRECLRCPYPNAGHLYDSMPHHSRIGIMNYSIIRHDAEQKV